MNRDCEGCIHWAKKSTVAPCNECGAGEQFEPFPERGMKIYGGIDIYGCDKDDNSMIWEDEAELSYREECLRKANERVNGDCRDKYGDLEDNFETIANLWNAYLEAIAEDRCDLTGVDVAIMMTLLKVGRTATGVNSDNLVDIAGYAACAYELIGGADGE